MTSALDAGPLTEPSAPLPRRLAQLMRPELPSLSDEIIAEIRRAVPEYARPLDGPYGQVLRAAVQQNLAAFVDRVAGGDAAAPNDGPRRLGQYEAREGRSMDCLQAAYRIGGQVAWRRIMRVAPRYDISSSIMSRLADALFVYLDELAAQSLDGYLEARAHPGAALEERRRRLLRTLLDPAAVPGPALLDLAAAAGWPMPSTVTVVALRPGARSLRGALDGDVLADLEHPEPALMLPGPLDTARAAMLEAAFPGRRLAAGPPVPPGRTGDALRWARQALALAAEGVLDGGAVIRCEDHLVTLWLMGDRPLLDQVAGRFLDVLDAMTPGQQDRITETLRTWLVTRGTAAEIARHLHIHPQTVRYRMRRIEQALGDRLGDPEARFGIEAVLRAMELRERSVPPPRPACR
ncbi:helix-turn-helix domain-containing protein [Actinomadura parmotrematis]|uniref:Helix-turn-helix domain-containing protein n=1 Tax=Actinomadura parmotrematis TaxID=2864039 RepID=A0ABS7FQ70_9ACTN|nr:helix-turn-helix domain-containing protein [Actinomadura parmotrematis]MBW8482115.1 helix-turn-helix domain-containing protein [Actinomadura parmotrematis]